MWKAIRIGVDGTLATVQIDDTTGDARVRGLNETIGSQWYDVVGYSDTIDVFVDDEGLYRSSLNMELSVMARAAGFPGVLFGAGVFLGISHDTGETLSLTDEQCAAITAAWRRPRDAREYRAILAATGQLISH